MDPKPNPNTPEGWIAGWGEAARSARYGRGWTHWIALAFFSFMLLMLVTGLVEGLI